MSALLSPVTLETIIALCKRRGFVYPSAEIYGGVNGIYDFGHLGTLMKQNIRKAWIQSLQNSEGEITQLEGALIGPEAMWKASGHLDGFHDPMTDCKNCKKRFRADEFDLEKGCPNCGKKEWTPIKNFNMMFKTQVGANEESASNGYLRPETAQAIYVNFKNVMTTSRLKIPFGIAQIGKAFRNEITPKQFLFRMREFEQMEMQWFCKKEDAASAFTTWIERRLSFYDQIGIRREKLRTRPHAQDELAHYATGCVDVEYEFPFGWKELEGIAHRGNFDLTSHTTHSGKDLAVFDEETQSSYIPDVVECSIGTDRLFLTLLFDAYREDVIEGETRVYLAFDPKIAPLKVAFLSLTKKLDAETMKLYQSFKTKGMQVTFDNAGSIGKRYRRYDEIGTPYCVTFDFQSLEDNCVTVRHRDTTKQERVSINELWNLLKSSIDLTAS